MVPGLIPGNLREKAESVFMYREAGFRRHDQRT
jgi:hypothetical protein